MTFFNINSNFRVFLTLSGAAFFYCMFSVAAVAATKEARSNILLHSGVKGDLFLSIKNRMDLYTLIKGKMIYQEEEDALHTKGYRPAVLREMEAVTYREIYDYPASESALSVYRGLIRGLEDAGLMPEYTCERVACGDAAAWRLHLGRHVVGHEDTQYYLLYKKNLVETGELYVAAYVNEIDGDPRLIIDLVSTWRSGNVKINLSLREAVNNRVAVRGSVLAGSTIYFDSGSVVPRQGYVKAVAAVARYVKANPAYDYAVVGYADSDGPGGYNDSLSQRRAETVRKLLADEPNLVDMTFKLYGFGERMSLAPYPLEGEDVEAKALNRMVQVVRLPR
jgi:outer membrane protein OmpA-like peptidoglycan-associated protein